jgi:hypothetical protein
VVRRLDDAVSVVAIRVPFFFFHIRVGNMVCSLQHAYDYSLVLPQGDTLMALQSDEVFQPSQKQALTVVFVVLFCTRPANWTLIASFKADHAGIIRYEPEDNPLFDIKMNSFLDCCKNAIIGLISPVHRRN